MVRQLVEKSIQIDAPASKVWRVLTEPVWTREWIRQWWPEVERIESDWRLGDQVVLRGRSGDVGALGEISAIDRPVRLTLRVQLQRAPSPRDQQVTYRLDERWGHTQLRVTVGDFDEDAPADEGSPLGAAAGWDRCLPKIKELSEKG